MQGIRCAMKFCCFWSRDRGSDGFTFLESAVGALVFAALGIAMVLFFTSLASSSAHSRRDAENATRAELFDRALRRETSMIAPPFWSGGVDEKSGDTFLTVNYYNGGKDSILGLAAGETGCSMTAGGRNELFKDIVLRKAGILEAGGAKAGISAEFDIGGKHFISKALFSAFFKGGAHGL